jgi:RNA polymerase sigma-70 factor, ECF subfamily
MSQVILSSAEHGRQPELGIVRKAQGGDERAFAILVRAYEPLVLTFVLRLVGDRSLAEDLTQEIFLRVFKALPGFSFRSQFTTWLLQVAKNRVLDEFRARDRQPRLLIALDDAPPPEVADAPLEQRETMTEIWQAIEGLPVALKMALLLRDVAGLPYTEIADTLDITLPTVKWRIFKAREQVVLTLARADVAPGQSWSATAGRPVAGQRAGD